MTTIDSPELGLDIETDRIIGANRDMNVVEYLRRFMLAQSQISLNAAMEGEDPEQKRVLSTHATLAAMCARAIDALEAGEDVVTVAWELYEAARDGEDLASWVAEELADRRIEIPA